MNLAQMRKKYAKRSYPSGQRYPPGRKDVLRLCDLAQHLETIVRDLQRALPADQQNEIERKLWALEN